MKAPLCLSLAVLLATPAWAQNLLVNGNFGTGNFSGWTQSGNTGFTNVVPSGNGYVVSAGPIGSLGFLSQTVATTAGTTYVLSYQLGSDGGTPNQFTAAAGATTLANQTNIPVQALTPYTFDFTATSVSTLVQFGFRDDPGALTFTDASFAPLDVTVVLTTHGLTPNEAGPISVINQALASGPNSAALSTLSTALEALPNISALGGAADQLAPTKFNQFASSTAFNNATFAVADMDNYLDGERTGPNGTFAGGNGQVDTRNFVIQDANVDPGLQMIHSRMLAWNDLPGTITDMPGTVLGGIDMKAVKPQCTACTASTPWNVFLRGSVVLAQDFSQADVPHSDNNTVAITAGADYRLTEHLLVGATMSYAHTDATLDDFGSSGTVDSYSPGVYASYADGGWFTNFIGRYSYNSYTENRNIAFLGQTANGGTDGHEGLVDLDGGYLFHSGPWSYGPVAGIQYTHLTVNGYTEQDSAANLAVQEDQSDSLRGRLGGEVRFDTCGCGVTFSPHLTATWQHEFLDQSRGLTSSFTQFSGGSFTVRTDDPSRDSALVDLGLDAKVASSVTVFGDYLVQAGQSNYFGQSLQAGVRVNF